jgi:hypothetical protein
MGGMDWINLAEDRDRWGGGSCKWGNKPLGSIKCREFLEWLRMFQLLRKGSAPWSK